MFQIALETMWLPIQTAQACDKQLDKTSQEIIILVPRALFASLSRRGYGDENEEKIYFDRFRGQVRIDLLKYYTM